MSSRNILLALPQDLSFHDVSRRIDSVGVSKAVRIGNEVWIRSVNFHAETNYDGSVIPAERVALKDMHSQLPAAGNPAVIYIWV